MNSLASRWARFLLAFGLVLAAGVAAAQSCAVSYSGTSIAFGVYDAGSGGTTTAAMSASLTCTHSGGGAQTVVWSMTLTNGRSGNCTARNMGGPGSDILNYSIYVNSIAGGIWGNAGCGGYPSGSMKLTNGAPNNIKTESYTLYGQLPAGQFNAGVGYYQDNLTLTITYN